jgi:hypothetical protein
LSDNTTGKDRKDLALWIFTAMSAHPDIGVVAKPSPQDVEAAQRKVGALLTRLIADSCPRETSAAIQSDGSKGMRVAFEFLGRMAMQELMSNPQVKDTLGGFERYVDMAKVNPVIAPRQ